MILFTNDKTNEIEEHNIICKVKNGSKKVLFIVMILFPNLENG